jgi:hypothetical protein
MAVTWRRLPSGIAVGLPRSDEYISHANYPHRRCQISATRIAISGKEGGGVNGRNYVPIECFNRYTPGELAWEELRTAGALFAITGPPPLLPLQCSIEARTTA